MTSPNLPFAPSGLIWDGVTEYQNVRPEGLVVYYILRMVGDGSRRYTDYVGTSNPMENIIRLSTQEDAWETIGVTYEEWGGFLGHQWHRLPGLRRQPIHRARQPNPLPTDLPAQRRRVRPRPPGNAGNGRNAECHRRRLQHRQEYLHPPDRGRMAAVRGMGAG